MKYFDYFMIISGAIGIGVGALGLIFILMNWEDVSGDSPFFVLLGIIVYFSGFIAGIRIGLNNLKYQKNTESES